MMLEKLSFERKIVKIGNGMGIILPKVIADALQITGKSCIIRVIGEDKIEIQFLAEETDSSSSPPKKVKVSIL